MQLLLDTHAFLWWIGDAAELSKTARNAIGRAENECLLSVASCWEMAIKTSLGKLVLSQPVERFIPEQLAANGFRLLGIDFRHCARVESLPFHHRDPFDRLLVAQALGEKLAIVSRDGTLSKYGVKRIW
jgi:PIN domain nuclease of toxin-antitoxin system